MLNTDDDKLKSDQANLQKAIADFDARPRRAGADFQRRGGHLSSQDESMLEHQEDWQDPPGAARQDNQPGSRPQLCWVRTPSTTAGCIRCAGKNMHLRAETRAAVRIRGKTQQRRSGQGARHFYNSARTMIGMGIAAVLAAVLQVLVTRSLIKHGG